MFPTPQVEDLPQNDEEVGAGARPVLSHPTTIEHSIICTCMYVHIHEKNVARQASDPMKTEKRDPTGKYHKRL